MIISEKDIEDLIVKCIKNGDSHKLHERGLDGLYHYDKFFRQFDLGDYGRLDLAAVKYDPCDQSKYCQKKLNVVVIEIKKGEINIGAFLQAIRYCKGIEHLLDRYNLDVNFKIKLIGTSVCKSDFVYLPDFFYSLDIYTVHLDLDTGITFKNERGYHLTNARQAPVTATHILDMKEYIKGKIQERINEPF